MESLALLSQTYHFDVDSKDLAAMNRLGLTWTVGMEGITDQQIRDGMKVVIQRHKYNTIKPAHFRGYCEEAIAEARPAESGSNLSGLIGGWKIRTDDSGRVYAYHEQFKDQPLPDTPPPGEIR
jgi:hypothetical protein